MSKTKGDQQMEAFILIDRTGSMQLRWDETLSATNEYVKKLGKDVPKCKFTVAVFDDFQGLQFDIVRDSVKAKDWKALSNSDATPRGGTPLLDALSRIIAHAEKADPKKAVLVVVTDGHENASRETTKDQAKAAIDRCKKRDWQIVFLGADFDAFDQAGSLGVFAAQTLNTTKGNYTRAFSATASLSADYANSGVNMAYSDKDRKDAVGENS